MIEGSDGRIYCLEFFRMTPRDANYVKGDKGTGLVGDMLLDVVGDSECKCYLLRSELFVQYIQQTLQTRRREVVMETFNEQKEAKQIAFDAALSDQSSTSAADEAKTEHEKQKVLETMNNGEFKITPEITQKLGAITEEVSSLKLNPNVFMSKNFAADVDPAIELKDEEITRKISKFLFKTMLPYVTEAIQSSEANVIDNRNMVVYLHSLGINMRYLGKLAALAIAQEQEDARLLLDSKQRQNSMPKYWLEFLEMEMIARGIKHLMRKYLSTNDDAFTAPAITISRMLSFLLGLPRDHKLDAFSAEDSKVKNKKDIWRKFYGT